MSIFFFCHYVFKKPSAAEASERVYMRERVNTAADNFSLNLFVFVDKSQMSMETKVEISDLEKFLLLS